MYIAIVDIHQKVGKYLTGRHFCMANYLTKITRWLYIINIEQLSAVIFLDRFHLSFFLFLFFFLFLCDFIFHMSCVSFVTWITREYFGLSLLIILNFGLYQDNNVFSVYWKSFFMGNEIGIWILVWWRSTHVKGFFCLLDILNVSAICLKDKG
jgi:hypothetical protein